MARSLRFIHDQSVSMLLLPISRKIMEAFSYIRIIDNHYSFIQYHPWNHGSLSMIH